MPEITDGELLCRHLPGAADVLVVMKTGSTELQAKLPVHLNTTTLCYPSLLILSDHEEEEEENNNGTAHLSSSTSTSPHKIHDALSPVSAALKQTHPDFALWRRLRTQGGLSALAAAELSGPNSGSGGADGKTENPGWRLDKWKFLPMALRALQLHPETPWFVFVETDTYLVWANLLRWVRLLDPKRPVYAGFQMQIGEQVFAHGGSGFVVSNKALRMVVEGYVRDKARWEMVTDNHWAGDCVLGRALEEVGVPLLWSWPLVQGEKPGMVDYWGVSGQRRVWCSPVVTYHHLAADEVEDVWRFEQDWIRDDVGLYDIDFAEEDVLVLTGLISTPLRCGIVMSLNSTSCQR